MSAMPSIYSDELTMALAAGKWWAMVEMSSPISQEPEYGGHICGQWGDLVEAQDTSCPTSLVFSNASEKAQRRSQHFGFLDATRKIMKQSRLKIAQGGPVPARSKPGATVPDRSRHWTPVAAPKDNGGVDPKGVPVHSGIQQGAPVPDGSPHGTPVAAPKDSVGLCQTPPQKLCVETDNINEKTQQLNCNPESHNHQVSRRRPEIRSSLRRGSQLSRKRASDNAGVDPTPVHSGIQQGTPVPDGSLHGTPVAAPKDSVGLCQAPPQKLCVESDNKNEKTQQLNCNPESHNHQASRRRPEIRSSLRRGSQLSRKKASDNAGMDPKGVPVHSGIQQGAPVPDGSPHGTPVAAPKDSVGLCQKPPQKVCVESDNKNEKTQQLNCNPESHNHQASRRRPEIRSSLRRGSQLSRKKASDNAGVDPKGVPVHSGNPQGAPVPDGSPHGTPVAAPKDSVGLCQAPPQKVCVETDNINEKTQQLNCNPESHNHQASRRRPEIRSSLRRGSQLSRKKASDNAGVDPKGVPVHSGNPQGAPVPDGSPHGTPVAAPKDSVGLCQAPPQKVCVESDNKNEKTQQLNCNPESHNHQASRRRPEIRSSLRRGSQLSRKKASDNAGVDPKGVPVHSGTPQGTPVPDGSPHGTPVAAPKDSVGLCQAPPQKVCVESANKNEKTQQLNSNPESHNHQASRRRPEIRSSLRRGSQLSRKKASDNAGVDPKGVPVHSGIQQGAPVPDGSPHGTPVAAPKELYVETDNINEKKQQLNFNLEIHNHQTPQRRPKIQSRLRCGSQLSRKRALDNAGVDESPPQKKQRIEIEVEVQQSEQGSLDQMDHLCIMFTNVCVISDM